MQGSSQAWRAARAAGMVRVTLQNPVSVFRSTPHFLGQRLQGESGAAIPAYEGLEQTWVDVFDQFDYRLNVECFVDMFEYSVQSVNNAYRSVWKPEVTENLLKIYSGQITFEQGMQAFQDAIREAAEDN